MARLFNNPCWFSLLAALLLPLASLASVPRECVAEYDLYLNGKRVGRMNSQLHKLHSNHWQYHVNTNARRGIIKASIKQRSEFVFESQRIRPVTFSATQKVAIAKRRSSANYDWSTMTAHGSYKGNDWELKMPHQFVDRLTISEQLRLDLQTEPQRARFDYVRLDRGKLRPMVFERDAAAQPIEVPAGSFNTTLLERDHGGRERRTASWHAAELDYLPVRMEQFDDGELTVSELTRFEGCRVTEPMQPVVADGESAHRAD